MECPMAKRQKIDVESCSKSIDSTDSHSPNEEMSGIDPSLKTKLRQFHVLDELEINDSDSDGPGQDSSGSEFDDNELDDLLDEGLPDDLRSKRKDMQYEERFKIVLEEKGHNHFEVLPEGWIKVTHNSGLPIFLHKSQRVCTLARPYFLGSGSVRKHEIPVSAIPCLNYRKALEREAQLAEEYKTDANEGDGEKTNESESDLLNNIRCEDEAVKDIDTGTDITDNQENSTESSTPPSSEKNEEQSAEENGTQTNVPALPNRLRAAKIETVAENTKAQSLTVEQIQTYCKSLFQFKQIRVMRFNSWSARRKFNKNKKNIKNLQRPVLPDGTKLITFPILDKANNTRTRKEWIMNPNGKSYVCILHEYVQHALKKQPVYEFKELENAATPYSATVIIDGLQYGIGLGTSKKQAKADAAREALEILIPDMREKINNEKKEMKRQNYCRDLSYFDEIRIEDPRVSEICKTTTEPPPHAILTTCLQRNYGLGDAKMEYNVQTTKNKKIEFTITVGKHSATVVCDNKRDGKQRASQAILQILHPHIQNWGSILRLYGNNSIKTFKEKKQEEQEITILQSKAAINQPNYAILNKLKEEMTKLRAKQVAMKPIGTFVPPAEVDLPSASGSNLNNVEL